MRTGIWKPLLACAYISGGWSALAVIPEGLIVAAVCAALALATFLFESTASVASHRRLHQVMLLSGGCAWVFATGVIDFATGYNIEIPVLYLIPIGFCAWFLPMSQAYGLAIAATVVWWCAHMIMPHRVDAVIIAWNASMRLVLFLLMAWGIGRDRAHRARHHDLAAQLHKIRGERAADPVGPARPA